MPSIAAGCAEIKSAFQGYDILWPKPDFPEPFAVMRTPAMPGPVLPEKR